MSRKIVSKEFTHSVSRLTNKELIKIFKTIIEKMGRAGLLKIFLMLIIIGIVSSFSYAADEFTLLKKEQIGNLRIDMPETEVRKTVHCTLKRGPDKLWGADGLYHQKWNYAKCGLVLDMVSEKKNTPKSIGSITIVRPSDLGTIKGVKIGSTENEVVKAYQSDWNREDSEKGKTFVAGSIYGGLIFSFRNGKVSSIFLGAAAE